MEYRRLGRTDLNVSTVCLGTMTWGEQNSETEAHQQIDYALDRGINFLDAAEMYPVPPKPETQGRTEAYIGTWLKARGKRDKIVLATKVCGRQNMVWVRGGKVKELRLDRAQINAAIDASLKRLQTDYVDLYQMHSTDRATNNFGKLGYVHKPDDDPIPLEETLDAMADLVKQGKVRAIGLSNETPWGAMQCVHLAETRGLPRVASIQNPYSLVNRSFEVGLAEVSHRTDVGLLAYSPLAMGKLSGKYLNGAQPEGARLTLFSRFQRYNNPETDAIVPRYVALAREHGLDPAQMALAFVTSRSFVTSTIIGATNLRQLKIDIEGCALKLSDQVLQEIDALHKAQPNPAP